MPRRKTMKKQLRKLSTFILILLALAVSLFSCVKDVDFKVDFIVDGEVYATVTTSGNEAIKIPENPTKEGYDFDGWYWDNGTWERPFTANSLLNEPLSADMSVYAKWKTGEHTHTPDDWTVDKNATCTEAGSRHKACTACGETVETEAIEKLAHTPVIDPAKSQTDTEDGLTEGSHCSVCSTVIVAQEVIPANLQSTAVSSKSLNITGEIITGAVSNTTEIFSFANDITTAKNASYVIATDISCSQPIASKTVSLAVGDNTFYLLVTCGSDVKLYYVTLRRLPTYTVSFNENGGTAVQNQRIEEGSLATEPAAPTRVGYTFLGWDYDFTKPITKYTTVSAIWTPNTDTAYKVEYYLEKLDGTYELKVTENLAGITDTTATAEIKTFTHFTHDTEAGILSGNIAGNGSLVLKVYYTRDYYTVTTSVDNAKAGSITAGGTYKYGTEIAVNATVTKVGYHFVGWHNGKEYISTDSVYTLSVTGNITLEAKIQPNTSTPYKVEYYLEKLDGTYELKVTENLAGITDTTATAEIKTFTHFTHDTEAGILSGNIAGNGSLVLKVYYTRDYYTVTTSVDNAKAGSITAGGTYKYGTEITVSISVNQGYTYKGIFSGTEKKCEETEYTFTVIENITLKAEIEANTDTPYTVKYYKQNWTGGYDLVDTQNLSGTTDTTATAEYEVPEGFWLNESKSKTSGNIEGDGSLVLVVYYYYSSYDRNGDYIYFGEYPQTLKADNVTITATQDSRGYYLGSDGFYYAKVVANPHNSGYTFSTGASVTDGATYYFKVEPIRWRILSEDGETALILCDSIIANKAYDEYDNGNYSNNYKESKIRQWLNESFYETAFTELQREMILTTTVDNSAASTGYSSNPHVCEDTEDKIFLLSYKEVTNSAYGFATSSSTYDTARRMQTSDYSRATGAYIMSTSTDYYGNGCWWLRSPYSNDSNYARYVYDVGCVGSNLSVYRSNRGVVPALQIRL